MSKTTLFISDKVVETRYDLNGSEYSFYSVALRFDIKYLLVYRRPRNYPESPDETLFRLQ